VYRIISRTLLGCILAAPLPAAETISAEHYANQYFDRQPVGDIGEFRTASDAYAFQHEVNAQFVARGHKPVGYKLGLTGESRHFGAPYPLYGQLFDFMRHADNSEISLSQFVKPLLELELAYQFETDLQPPFTVERITAAIRQVAPAVELGDMVFANPRALSWQQLAATGVGARRMIIGTPLTLDGLDLDHTQAEARWNGELYSRGYGRNVMGSQMRALTFLAEQLAVEGQSIKAGDWVLSGAMNRMLPAKVGDYSISFGQLGELNFTLQP